MAYSEARGGAVGNVAEVIGDLLKAVEGLVGEPLEDEDDDGDD